MAYRADIEIAVRGAQQLRQLKDELNATSKAVESVNNFIENFSNSGVVRSINTLRSAVAQAASEFNKVAVNTDEAVIAARQYIRATDELNTSLQERLALLRQIKNEERIQATANVAKALRKQGITLGPAFTGELGPGPASAVGTLAGQKSPVEEIIRRTLQAKQDEIDLQNHLLELENKSAQLANEKLQAQKELTALTARSVNAMLYQVTQPAQQLALPAYTERGLQLLDNSVKANESNLRIETALNGERARGVRFLEKQTQEEQRQVQLGLLGLRTNQLPGTARARGTIPTGGFPTAGPLPSPGFQKTQRQIGKFGENLALGAGFPLLFGGGPGAVGGSILGSFFGTGFGGQILGGAIGQILDAAVQKTAKLGTALQTLDFKALEESGLRVNANLEVQINLLRQAGNLVEAQNLLQREVTATTGALPGTVEGITDSVNILSAAWSEFTAAAGVTLGIIGAPFAAALGAVIQAVATLFKGFNVVASALATALKITGEWVIKLLAGQSALDGINSALQQNNIELEKARASYIPILGQLNGEILLSRKLLDLEKQKTVENTAAARSRNAQLTYEQNVAKVNDEYSNKIREAREKLTKANANFVAQQVQELQIKRNIVLEGEKDKLNKDLANISATESVRLEREREKAMRDAARAAQEELNSRKQLLQLENSVSSAAVDRLNAESAYNKLTMPESDYLDNQKQTLIDIFGIQAQMLQIEEAAAKLGADPTQLQLINDLYAQKRNTLQFMYATAMKQNTLDAEELANRQALLVVELQRAAITPTVYNPLEEQKAAVDALIEKYPVLSSVADSAAGLMTAGFQEIITGTKSVEQVFADFLRNIANALLQAAQQMIAQYILIGIARRFAFGGGGMLDFSAGGPNILGAAGAGFTDFGASNFVPTDFNTAPFDALAFSGGYSSGFNFRAAGGPVSSGQPYVVGERGPELFVPGRSGAIVPNNQLGASTSVVVNVDAKGTSVQGNDQTGNQLARAVAAAVQAELVKQRRPGGLLTA